MQFGGSGDLPDRTNHQLPKSFRQLNDQRKDISDCDLISAQNRQ